MKRKKNLKILAVENRFFFYILSEFCEKVFILPKNSFFLLENENFAKIYSKLAQSY